MEYKLAMKYEKHLAGIAPDEHAVVFIEPTDNPYVERIVKTVRQAGLEMLSIRAKRGLVDSGIKTLEQMDGKLVKDVLKIPNIGMKTVEEIQRALAPLKMSLLVAA